MAIKSELPPVIQRLIQKVASDPQSRAFVQLADLYFQCDLFEEAVGVLSEGLRRHPSYVSARMMRGKIYLQMKRLREAKDDFEAVIQAHPEHIQAYRSLAHIYRTIGKLGEAVTMCNKILAIDSQDKAAFDLLSSVQEEIATVDEIHALAPSPDAPAAPDWAHYPEGPLLDRSREALEYPTRFSASEAASSPSVLQGEAMPPLEQAHDPAQDALTALNLARLQTWLVSIQTRRKKR